MNFNDWLTTGIRNAWCGPAVCETHDGTPTSAKEDDQFDAGDEPCIFILRLYDTATTRDAVELNHSPSVWRKLS